MRSHILGKIDLDHDRLAPELETILRVPRIHEEYDEFSSGYWTNVSLWNASGEKDDTVYRDIKGSALVTEHGRQVPYINELIHRMFDTEKIKMVRARNLIDAVLLPHRDFIELDKDNDRYFRVVFGIEDNVHAFHSDDETVLRMRAGEIWYLDAAAIHAAVNFSTQNRRAICVDFAFDSDFHESDVFADKAFYTPNLEPELPVRKPFTRDDREDLMSLGRVLDVDNFSDIVFMLSKLHFRYNVPTGEAYEWLVDIAKEAGNSILVERAEQLQKYMVGARGFGERFSMNHWS